MAAENLHGTKDSTTATDSTTVDSTTATVKPDRLLRATQFYWEEMVELKALCTYHQLYRDDQAKWGTRLDFIKAIAASSTIAGWAIWQNYAIVWGAIIASAQLIDALKEVFPYAKIRKASAELANVLDGLFIDARVEFEKISFGNVTAEEASDSLRSLQKLRRDAEARYFPEGIIKKSDLQQEADRQTKTFFKQVYSPDDKGN